MADSIDDHQLHNTIRTMAGTDVPGTQIANDQCVRENGFAQPPQRILPSIALRGNGPVLDVMPQGLGRGKGSPFRPEISDDIIDAARSSVGLHKTVESRKTVERKSRSFGREPTIVFSLLPCLAE